MGIERLARAPVEAAVRSGRTAVAGEVERVAELLMAGPFPEHVAHAIVDQRVLERLAADEELRKSLDEVVEKIVSSPAFEQALTEVMSSPAVRNALRHEAVGYWQLLLDALRRVCTRWDNGVEWRVRRWTRRAPAALESRTFAGLVTQLAALTVDAAIVQTIFLFVVGSLALVGSIVHAHVGSVLGGAAAAVIWLLIVGFYFVGGWTASGLTPGMRLLQIRILAPNGSGLSFPRALGRLVALFLSIVLLFLGFVPILFDRRRRAFHDMVSGTVVVHDQRAATAS